MIAEELYVEHASYGDDYDRIESDGNVANDPAHVEDKATMAALLKSQIMG